MAAHKHPPADMSQVLTVTLPLGGVEIQKKMISTIRTL